MTDDETIRLLDLPSDDWPLGDRSFLGNPRIEVYADFQTPREMAEWTRPAVTYEPPHGRR